MQTFQSDGTEIAFLEEGSGEPILLLHGFASNARVNWVDTGWVRHLVREGRRVIAMDCRGHGASQKFYTSQDYGPHVMAGDARRLLDLHTLLFEHQADAFRKGAYGDARR